MQPPLAPDNSTAATPSETKREPAVLSAFREDDQLWVWCEHEQLWHRHGGACDCPATIGAHPDPNWDGECECFGVGDGHRGAHCRCAYSPHRRGGYVLREVGPLTAELLAQHREADYIHGCRSASWSQGASCRLSRAKARHRRQHPELLAGPDEPLEVARELVKGYTALDWTDVAFDRVWPFSADGGPPSTAYDVQWDGPLALRRWRGAWWAWLETHWVQKEDDELDAEIWDRLGGASYVKSLKDGFRLEPWQPNPRKVSAVAEALGGVVLTPARFEAPGWLDGRESGTSLVSCRNGLLDTATRELVTHDPDWFNLVAVPYDYDPLAPPPRAWLEFLTQIWPEDSEAIDSLQEWFGYVLSGRTDLQKMMLVVGPPRSGKGTIVRVLQALVGRGNYAGPTLASLGTNFGLQALIGKPLAVVADARLGGKDTHIVVERLLSISGEDSLTIDRKYRDAWTGRLPTRLMVLSNELPHFGDISGAIATRFVTLTMTQSWLGKEDVSIERRLRAELPSILMWALDGLARLDSVGRFAEPASSAEAVIAMADSASPTGAFVRDRCVVRAGESVSAKTLYAAWRGWCIESSREHPGSEQTFGRTLRSVVPTMRVTRPRDPATGQQVRTYEGIGLLRRDETRLSPLSSEDSVPEWMRGPV